MKRLSAVNKTSTDTQELYNGLQDRLNRMAKKIPNRVKSLKAQDLTNSNLKDLAFTAFALGTSLRDMASDTDEIGEILQEIIEYNK